MSNTGVSVVSGLVGSGRVKRDRYTVGRYSGQKIGRIGKNLLQPSKELQK